MLTESKIQEADAYIREKVYLTKDLKIERLSG